jgi:hypothetical protein
MALLRRVSCRLLLQLVALVDRVVRITSWAGRRLHGGVKEMKSLGYFLAGYGRAMGDYHVWMANPWSSRICSSLVFAFRATISGSRSLITTRFRSLVDPEHGGDFE